MYSNSVSLHARAVACPVFLSTGKTWKFQDQSSVPHIYELSEGEFIYFGWIFWRFRNALNVLI